MHLSFSGDMLYEERTFSTFLGLTLSPSSGINAHKHKLFSKSPHSYRAFIVKASTLTSQNHW